MPSLRFAALALLLILLPSMTHANALAPYRRTRCIRVWCLR